MNEVIKDAIKNDSLVLFLGAGVSKPLGFPDWNKLLILILEELKKEIKDKSPINFDYYISQSEFEDVFTVLDNLEQNGFKAEVKNALYNIISNVSFDNASSEVINLLWRVSDKIITTNYDKVLEKSKPDYVESFDHSNEFQQIKSIEGQPFLYKLHGDISDPSSCILFRSDYESIYGESSNKETLKNILLNKTVLFIGFSLNDPFINHELQHLYELFKNFGGKHYILQTNERDLRKYHVESITIDNWGDSLINYLNNLSSFKNERKILSNSPDQFDINKIEDIPLLRGIYSEKLNSYSSLNETKQKSINGELYKIRDRILELESKKMELDFQSTIPNHGQTELEHLFNMICASEKLSINQINHIQKIRNPESTEYFWYHRSVIVSAIACSIINHKNFDPKKIELLIDFTNDHEDKVWQKGLTYLFITLNHLGNKWLRFTNLQPKLELLKGHNKIQQALGSIIAILQWDIHNSSFMNRKIFENAYFQNSTFNYFLPFYQDNPSVHKLFHREDIEEIDNVIQALYTLPIPDSLKYLFCNNESTIIKKNIPEDVENRFLITLHTHKVFEPYLNYINELVTYYNLFPNLEKNLNHKISIITVNNLKKHLLNSVEHNRVMAQESALKESWNDAISYYEKLLSIETEDQDALRNMANCMENAEKDFDSCIKLRLRIFDLFPKDHFNISKIGFLYKQKEDYYNALSYINMSLDLKQNDPNYLYQRGRIFVEMDQDQEALNDFNSCLSILPNDIDFLNSRGMIYLNLENYDDALIDFDRVTAIDSNNIDAYYGRSCVYQMTMKLDEAKSEVNKGISVDRKDSDLYELRSSINLSEKNHEDALIDIEKAILLNPKKRSHKKTKADVLEEMGRFIDALSELDKLSINTSKDRADINNLKANILRRINRISEAHILIDEAIEIDDNCLYLGTKAAIFAMEGDNKNFYKYSELSLKKNAKLKWFKEDILRKYLNEEKFIGLAQKYNQKLPVLS